MPADEPRARRARAAASGDRTARQATGAVTRPPGIEANDAASVPSGSGFEPSRDESAWTLARIDEWSRRAGRWPGHAANCTKLPVQPPPHPAAVDFRAQAPHLVRHAPPPTPVARHARPVRAAGQRGHAPADPGRPRDPVLRGVPRPLPDRHGARGRHAARRARGLERPRLQPPRAPAPGGGARGGARRLARRPHRAAGRRPVHGGGGRLVRLGSPAGGGRHQRAARDRAFRRHVVHARGAGPAAPPSCCRPAAPPTSTRR